MFTYESNETLADETPEFHFRRQVFYPLIDAAITSLRERFAQLERFNNLFGFLCSVPNMQATVTANSLDLCCQTLMQMMGDIDAGDLSKEINIAVHSIPTTCAHSPLAILDYIYKENLVDVYPNLNIALRLLLTVPVTVASAERTFSRMNLIKSYLRSSMCQERLNGLAYISIEHELARSLDYSAIITDFAASKAGKVSF